MRAELICCGPETLRVLYVLWECTVLSESVRAQRETAENCESFKLVRVWLLATQTYKCMMCNRAVLLVCAWILRDVIIIRVHLPHSWARERLIDVMTVVEPAVRRIPRYCDVHDAPGHQRTVAAAMPHQTKCMNRLLGPCAVSSGGVKVS